MRKMGDLAGVEIEPEQQTHLLDLSIEQAGVIGGGVPGGQSCFFRFEPHLDLRSMQLADMTPSGC